jgi:hypothetical protein
MKSRPEFPLNGWSSPLLTPKSVLFQNDRCGPSPLSGLVVSQRLVASNLNHLLTLMAPNAVNNG